MTTPPIEENDLQERLKPLVTISQAAETLNMDYQRF